MRAVGWSESGTRLALSVEAPPQHLTQHGDLTCDPTPVLPCKGPARVQLTAPRKQASVGKSERPLLAGAPPEVPTTEEKIKGPSTAHLLVQLPTSRDS